MIYPNLALCGKAGSGKDTVAAHLCEAHGYTRLAFADPLKEMAVSVDPWVAEPGLFEYDYEHMRLSEVIRDLGWDYAKSGYPEVRRLLQHMGQTVRSIDPDFWIRALLARAAEVSGPIVVTDVRYPNEYASMQRAGMVAVRVTRPGAGLTGDAGAHDSETALDGYAYTTRLLNDGSLELLHARIDALVHAIPR